MSTHVTSSVVPMARYAISQLGKAIIWCSMEVYALYFLSKVLGMQPARVGALFLALLLVDAAANLIVGLTIDQIATLKHLNLLVLTMTPLTAGTFVLGFVLQSQFPSVVWAVGFMQLSRIAFVLVDVPHNMLLLELVARGYHEVKLATLRQTMGLLALLLVGGINLQFADRILDAPTMLRIAFATGVTGGMLLLAFPRFGSPDSLSVGDQTKRIIGSIGSLVSRKIVLLTLVFGLLHYTASSFIAHTLPFAAAGISDDAKLTGTMLLAIAAIKLAVAPGIGMLAHRFGLALCGIAVALVFGGAGLSAALGLLGNLSHPFALAAIGLFDSGTTIVGWAFVMRAHRATAGTEAGTGRPGVLTAFYTSMGRVGSGVSGLLLSGILMLPESSMILGIGWAMAGLSVLTVTSLLAVNRAFAHDNSGT